MISRIFHFFFPYRRPLHAHQLWYVPGTWIRYQILSVDDQQIKVLKHVGHGTSGLTVSVAEFRTILKNGKCRLL